MRNDDTKYTSPLIYLLAAFLAFQTLPLNFLFFYELKDTGPTWLGLDASWRMTINHANLHNWTWGEDICYTYGPLGFLSTRIGWGVSRWVFLLFDWFLAVNFFFVFKDFLKSSASKLLAMLILGVAMLLLHPDHGRDLGWLLLFFIYYWLYKSYLKPSNASFVIIVSLILIAFFVKLNTGLIGACIFSVHLLLLFKTDKISLRNALIILLSFGGTLLLSAWLLNVDLPGYIRAAMEIVKGYGNVMYMDNGEIHVERNLLSLYKMLNYLLIVYFVYILFKGSFMQCYFVGICAVYVVLLKQQAYLRGDINHLSEFFGYGPLILLVGNMLYYNNRAQKLFSLGILFVLTLSLYYKKQYSGKMTDMYAARFNSKREYFKQFADYNSTSHRFQPEKRHIPQSILAKIGGSSIDVFPWDSEYLIENQLNYHPRPVFQSFSAYTPYLQQINYDFYVNKGPEYILYDYDAIDNRCPFNDEAMLNMYIVKNYELTDTFTSNERLRLVLKRKSIAKRLVLHKLGEKHVDFSGNIPIMEGVDFIKIYVGRNFKGEKIAFKLRPPDINISFTTATGYNRIFKTSPGLLEAGLTSERLITSQEDYISLFTQKDVANTIAKIELIADQSLFNNEVIVEYYNVK